MLTLRHGLLILAASVPCLLLFADDDADVPPVVQVVRPQFQREVVRKPVILEEPVRLQFSVDEGEGHRFDVVCVSEDYRISVDMGNQDGENHIEVSGTLQPHEEGRLFLTFDATIHHSNLAEGSEVTFSATGSTLVTPGERAKLVTFPGPTLSVTVSPVE